MLALTMLLSILISFTVHLPVSRSATTFYVSQLGSDDNPGTEASPFQSIQKAADLMGPGDTCYIRAGRYRETVRLSISGQKGNPIRFRAYPGEEVVLDGTEPLSVRWVPSLGETYKSVARVPAFEQLFVDEEMMIEARWPNARFDQLLERSTWAEAQEGSDYGKIVSKKLANTPVDWTGALAVLNVGHQFWTWTRTVEKHDRRDGTIQYSRDLGSVDRFDGQLDRWSDDYFYLVGKLEALDTATEWFRDPITGELYLQLEDGADPGRHEVSYKARDWGFVVENCEYIELEGFQFFGTTFQFQKCDWILVSDCQLVFPSYSRRVSEFDPLKKSSSSTLIVGDHNVIRNVTLAYASNSGITMLGESNTIENSIVHDLNWFGTLSYPAVKVFPRDRSAGGQGGVVRSCTLYNSGNAILCFNGRNSVVEYNHVYDGGLLCKDVALVYTQQPTTEGSVVRYNWVHGCRTHGHVGRGGQGGLGIRGDDQTRGLTVHHNVVWDCGRDGIIIKGDRNRVYNNTVFGIGSQENPGNYINLPVQPEPEKVWREQYPLLKSQNVNSQAYNNSALTISSSNKGTSFPENDHRLSHNYVGVEMGLMNVADFDFRPRKGSPLIDQGRVVEGITAEFTGKAPDIGAYEFGGEFWKAGAETR